MKLVLIRTALFFCLLSVLVQCSSDQGRRVVPLQVSPEAIAADTSFLRIVTLTTDMRDVLYNNLRDAHSDVKRTAMSKRINSLLSRNDRDSLVLAIKMLGFKDVNQYLVHLSQIAIAKRQLAKSGIFLEKLPLPALTEATRLAANKLGRKYPVIFARQPLAAKQAAKTLGNGDICWQCHYNNCDECGSQIDPGTIAEDGTFEDGPGYSCRRNAAIKRQSNKDIATAAMIAGLLGCGWTAGEIATYTTGITIGTGPLAPVIGGGVGGIYVTGCAGLAIYVFSAALNGIESDYQTALAGCRN